MNAGSRSNVILALCALAVVAAAVLIVFTSPTTESPDQAQQRSSEQQPQSTGQPADQTAWIPAVQTDRGFVGSDACLDCHAENHASWKDSYHSTMTQTASDESVVPEFEDVVLTGRGRTWELSRRDDRFWVRMADPDWERSLDRRGVDLLNVPNPPIVERQVVLTTGSHNFQTYWVPSRQPRLLVQLPWFYSIANDQWIPAEDTFLQPDPGRDFVNWHAFCLRCHSVGGVPGFSQDSLFVDTRVAELGISCEACHGPSEEHVALQIAAKESGQTLAPEDDPVVNPGRMTARQASHVCGQCHCQDIPTTNMTTYLQSGMPFRAGDDLEELSRIVQIEDKVEGSPKDQFWHDGACRVGGDEFNGLADSPCYLNGTGESQLSCLSCHSMHHYSEPTYQLGEQMDGNHACTQCHSESQYTDQVETHTHHPPASSGSLCFNCHMPRSSFALLKGIRSHRIDSPVVYSVGHRGSRPNACNLCHLDQTLDWSSRHLADWFGVPQADLSEDDRSVAASLLWILKGDAIQRTVVAWHMGWQPAQEVSGDTWQAPFIGQLLRDPYAATRLVATNALKSLPGFEDFEFNAVDATQDRSRVVSDVVTRWRSAAPQAESTATLIGPDGELLQDLLDRLLSERDDTHVYIAE